MARLGFLGAARQTVRGFGLLRRLLVELRGIRRALERQADVLELSAGTTPRETLGGQVFRSYSHVKAVDPQDPGAGSSIEYVDNQTMAQLLAVEDELRAVLGRDPTEHELERAFRGEGV